MNIFSIRDLEPSEDTMASQSPTTIMVIGTGSGGSNAIDHFQDSGLSGVQFIAVNTDRQHLYCMSKAKTKLHIGSKLTGGRGAGGDPEKGEEAAKEDSEMLRKTMKGADMVFLTTGMGGGTGTGSIPVIANIAKESGALTVGVVTTPFEFEGPEKMQIAIEGIEKLREEVDTLIVIPNQNLYKMIVDRKTSFPKMLKYADEILLQAVQGISDLVTNTGHINCDFADVEATMKGQGVAHLGIGCGTGENRVKDAVDGAIENPLLEDVSISGASRLLVNIAGTEDIPAAEVKEILEAIRAKAGKDAKMKFGITYDPNLGENIKVTVIATGLNNADIASEKEKDIQKNDTMEEWVEYAGFQAMKGIQNDKRQNDNFGNYFKTSEDYKTIREIPAISRMGATGEFIYGDKIAANGRDA